MVTEALLGWHLRWGGPDWGGASFPGGAAGVQAPPCSSALLAHSRVVEARVPKRGIPLSFSICGLEVYGLESGRSQPCEIHGTPVHLLTTLPPAHYPPTGSLAFPHYEKAERILHP